MPTPLKERLGGRSSAALQARAESLRTVIAAMYAAWGSNPHTRESETLFKLIGDAGAWAASELEFLADIYAEFERTAKDRDIR
jgi:hypothetical protein